MFPSFFSMWKRLASGVLTPVNSSDSVNIPGSVTIGDTAFALTYAQLKANDTAGKSSALAADITLTEHFTPTMPIDTNGHSITLGAYNLIFTSCQPKKLTDGCFVQSGSGAVSGLKNSSPDYFGVTNVNDNQAFVNAIAAGNGHITLTAREYTLTASLDSVTNSNIYISGSLSAFKFRDDTTTQMAVINLDDTAIVGAYASGTDTVTYSSQLKQLNNVVLKAQNSAKYAAIGNFFYAKIHDIHIDGFTDHGIWSVGSVISSFENISGYNVGVGKSTTGALNADTFIDGCLLLLEASTTQSDGTPHPSGEVGNHAYCRVFASTNFSSTLQISNIFSEFAATTTTSFKTLIAFNVRSSTLTNVNGYSGAWFGYCSINLVSPHFEVYSTGGAVAADGTPLSLVSFNSSIKESNPVYTEDVRYLRTTAFGVNTDYWGYSAAIDNKHVFSHAHIAEMTLGDYKPDSESYAITRVPGLGSINNPRIAYDATTGSVLASKGTTYTPILGIPLYVSDTVASGGYEDVDSSIIAPSSTLGDTVGNMIYDLDVQIVDLNFGRVYYHGSWKAVRQNEAGNYSIRFYELGHIDNNAPGGGFTVAENGAGPYTLRVSNGTAFGYTYIVYGRCIGVTGSATP